MLRTSLATFTVSAILCNALFATACGGGSTAEPTPGSTAQERSSSEEETIDGKRKDAGPADAGEVDAGHHHHHKKDGGGAAVLPTTPGQILVTEVMFDPSTVEPNTEWFELTNTTTSHLLLSGLILKDGGGRTHTIASSPEVVLGAGKYAVFARLASDCETVAQVPASAILYEYGTGLSSGSGILLANGTTGGLSVLDPTGTTVLAEAPYGTFGVDASGKSLQISKLSFGSESNAAHWCTSATQWATGADYGTPGAAGDCP